MNEPKCWDAMHVFHHLARDVFLVQIVYRWDVGRVEIHKFQNLVQVMFWPIIRTDKRYVGCKYTNFITSSGIFQALFVSDRLYVKCQNTSSFRWSKSSLSPIFSTVKSLFVRNYTNFITFREQIKKFDYFEWMLASVFIQHRYAGVFTKVPIIWCVTWINTMKLHVELNKGFYSVGSGNNWCSFSAKIELCRNPMHEFLQLEKFILRYEMQHR